MEAGGEWEWAAGAEGLQTRHESSVVVGFTAVRCKDGADKKMGCSSQAPFVMVETSNCRVRADMEGINLSN